MPDYRYIANKIIKNNDSRSEAQTFEKFVMADSEDKVREFGNFLLLKSNPDCNLDDFAISISLK